MAALVDWHEGMTVRVMNRTLSGKDVDEGTAIIIKINQGDKQGIHADVLFDGEARIVQRWVFAQFQSDDLEAVFET